MSEGTSTPFRSGVGEAGEPVMGEICPPPNGQAGRDHPDQQGQVFAAIYPISPTLGQANPQPGHWASPFNRGPIGQTTHDRCLDGMMVAGTRYKDGSIQWHWSPATWTGGQTQGAGGATGEPTYVGRGPEKG